MHCRPEALGMRSAYPARRGAVRAQIPRLHPKQRYWMRPRYIQVRPPSAVESFASWSYSSQEVENVVESIPYHTCMLMPAKAVLWQPLLASQKDVLIHGC